MATCAAVIGYRLIVAVVGHSVPRLIGALVSLAAMAVVLFTLPTAFASLAMTAVLLGAITADGLLGGTGVART